MNKGDGKEMKEVKFRVYGKENGFMYDWDELLNMDSFTDHMRFATGDDIHYSPLMQYTGLKDMNGKEIYEGDIINNSVVYWSPQWAMFSVTGEGIGALIRFADDYAVQGNIYENPKLI